MQHATSPRPSYAACCVASVVMYSGDSMYRYNGVGCQQMHVCVCVCASMLHPLIHTCATLPVFMYAYVISAMALARNHKQNSFVNPFGKSWYTNHRRGFIWASGKHLARIWKHLRSIWNIPGKHLGRIWEASGRHLGGIWDSNRSRGFRELQITRTMPLSI